MTKEMFNKYGLSGSSGLSKEYGLDSQIIHIAANYGVNEDDEVFVECYYNNYFDKHRPNQSKKYKYDHWTRMKKDYAIKRGYRIIKCCKCGEIAVSLDHHYPYYIDGNLCKLHNKRARK